ncbi:hypothetical protein [Nocardiopsis sp. CC223A]|nr:hypothetical protein [Nocardiopsis sp. CC223A]
MPTPTPCSHDAYEPALADAVEAARRTARADATVSDALDAVDEGRAGR